MMGKWEIDSFQDDDGDAIVLEGATVTVRNESNGDLAVLYSEQDTGSPGPASLSNPFTVAGSTIIFYAETSENYRITITKGALTRTVRYEAVKTPPISQYVGDQLLPANTAALFLAAVGVGINGLTEDTAPDKVSDFLLEYDASTNTAKKVKPYNVAGILQVQSTAKTDTFSSASTSFTDVTGLSVSITPKSTASKVLVVAMVSVCQSLTTDQIHLTLVRGSTEIFRGDAASTRPRLTASAFPQNQYNIVSVPIIFLDSPASASATTYKIQGKVKTGTFYVNRNHVDGDDIDGNRNASSITVIEVAG